MCWPYASNRSGTPIRISTCPSEDLLHTADFQLLCHVPTHTLYCAVAQMSDDIDLGRGLGDLEVLLNAVYQELARRV